MSDTVEALVLDLLEWLGAGPRPYAEVMDAWRTSCPRLPVWEDASDLGLVERRRGPGGEPVVCVTPAGEEYLRAHRHAVASLVRIETSISAGAGI